MAKSIVRAAIENLAKLRGVEREGKVLIYEDRTAYDPQTGGVILTTIGYPHTRFDRLAQLREEESHGERRTIEVGLGTWHHRPEIVDVLIDLTSPLISNVSLLFDRGSPDVPDVRVKSTRDCDITLGVRHGSWYIAHDQGAYIVPPVPEMAKRIGRGEFALDELLPLADQTPR